MADAMESALTTSIVRDGEETPEHDQNLGVELSADRFFGTTMNWQDVPPHVAHVIQGLRTPFVAVQKVGRAPRCHYLLEEWNEGTEGSKADSSGNG
jgi:hypothetical protein